MSIVCGYIKYKECKSCTSECSNYTPVYTGDDYTKEILKTIVNIYSEYGLDNIKNERGIKYILLNIRNIGNIRDIVKIKRLITNYDSLRYMMGIYGHCSEFENDLDNIFYDAATIVLIQQHLFKQCSTSERYKAYKLMSKLGIRLDEKMMKDYRIIIKKRNKFIKIRCKLNKNG